MSWHLNNSSIHYNMFFTSETKQETNINEIEEHFCLSAEVEV